MYKQDGSHPFRRCGKDLFYRRIFGGDIAVNLFPVGMVIGQSRMNLRQSKMLDLGGNLLGSETQVVPPGYAPQRDAGSSNARPAFTDLC